jgi:hypothetical protein
LYTRVKKVGPYSYLQLVEGYREGSKVKQRVVATIGRLDQLKESGALQSLARTTARHCDELLLLDAHLRGEAIKVAAFRIGAGLIFERLWRETGCYEVLRDLSADRNFSFSVERAVFLTVLHRLFNPGSDRAAHSWIPGYRIQGVEQLELHHLYRAMAWLGEALPPPMQAGSSPFGPRTTKDLVEEALFHRQSVQQLKQRILVLIDTTSFYFYGRGGRLGKHGYSRDHKPQLRQLVLAQVLDESGLPLCCEVWPGNTTDPKALVPLVNRLRERFGIRDICVVADRGMISAGTVEQLEQAGWSYILGARMRNEREVDRDVLSRGGRYTVVRGPRSSPSDPSPLKVKEVIVGDNRYVVCKNEERAKIEAEQRESILSSLMQKLNHGGPKSLVGNSAFRKLLRSTGVKFEVDQAAVKRAARYDGTWVLRTNTDWPADFVAFCYKQLCLVEDSHRTMKTILETRPIYHHRDDTIRGHVFCSSLALRLRHELLKRLAALKVDASWSQVIQDLDVLTETELEHEGKRFQLRGQPTGCCSAVFQAVGVALPPTVRQVVEGQPID